MSKEETLADELSEEAERLETLDAQYGILKEKAVKAEERHRKAKAAVAETVSQITALRWAKVGDIVVVKTEPRGALSGFKRNDDGRWDPRPTEFLVREVRTKVSFIDGEIQRPDLKGSRKNKDGSWSKNKEWVFASEGWERRAP